MCEMQKLRLSVEQILTAAAEEIFGVFKRSAAEIDEKLSDFSKDNHRNRGLPDAEQQTECPPFIQKLWMVKEELLLEQQERTPTLDQMDPESPHIKEEENLWSNQEGEHLQGLEESDITWFPSTAPSVKSEYDGDEAQSSQLYHSQTEENTEEPEDEDDYGGSEADSIQNNDIPISDVACEITQHQYTEEDETCKISSALETQMTDEAKKKPFSCSVCQKCFVTKSQVKEHMTVHAGEKPFTCSFCKKGFVYKSRLKQHMLIHTGERRFRCSVCQKRFVRNGNLKQHMLIHTGEKPFSCPVCGKGFVQNSTLKKHMVLHSGERTFNCSVCGKSFDDKISLKNHTFVHAGEKIYSCTVCNRLFARKFQVQLHMSVHALEKPFSSVCKEGSSNKQDLSTHVDSQERSLPST